MSSKWVRVSALAALLIAAAPSAAQPPAPIDAGLFAFPGAAVGPASAVSAGLALADRWLGEAPFDNPAIPARGVLSFAPSLVRVSRQDLRADHRHYDERAGFFDGAGAWAGIAMGGLETAFYVFQPVFRREENAFERGEFGAPTPPAVIQTEATAREVRAGLAASVGSRALRIGAAGEWTRREDRYAYAEQSGAPDEGTRSAEFSGTTFGVQAGARLDLERPGEGGLVVGAAVRYLPELAVEGEQTADLTLSGSSQGPVAGKRLAGWEGGVSVRYAATPAFRVTAGVGGRTAQAWHDFGVTNGAALVWTLGGEFHDSRDPWTVRFGLGRESERGVPEPRAGIVALGFGWRFGDSTLDLGVLRRSFERAGHPTSFDDRLVGSIGLPF